MTALRPCVLIVDGDAAARRGLVRLLHPIAHVVDVDSAEAALTVLATGTVFDAVLVQLSLPVMSGPELLRVIRRDHAHVAARFVAMADDDACLADEAFRSALGGRLLVQPFGVEELRDMVVAVAGTADAAAE